MRVWQERPGQGFAHWEIPDPRPESEPLAALLMAEDRTTRAAEERHLAAQMAALPPREQAVLRLRFGFDEEPLRPGQIAARLGVCRKTVYNLQERALNRLRVRVERT